MHRNHVGIVQWTRRLPMDDAPQPLSEDAFKAFYQVSLSLPLRPPFLLFLLPIP